MFKCFQMYYLNINDLCPVYNCFNTITDYLCWHSRQYFDFTIIYFVIEGGTTNVLLLCITQVESMAVTWSTLGSMQWLVSIMVKGYHVGAHGCGYFLVEHFYHMFSYFNIVSNIHSLFIYGLSYCM